MSKPRDNRQKDLLRAALDESIDPGHALVCLAGEIDWVFLDQRFSPVCTPGPGQPPLPSRLVAGLLILKHTHDLSHEVLCDRWFDALLCALIVMILRARRTPCTFHRDPIQVGLGLLDRASLPGATKRPLCFEHLGGPVPR